jgi:hypothetical protein
VRGSVTPEELVQAQLVLPFKKKETFAMKRKDTAIEELRDLDKDLKTGVKILNKNHEDPKTYEKILKSLDRLKELLKNRREL